MSECMLHLLCELAGAFVEDPDVVGAELADIAGCDQAARGEIASLVSAPACAGVRDAKAADLLNLLCPGMSVAVYGPLLVAVARAWAAGPEECGADLADLARARGGARFGALLGQAPDRHVVEIAGRLAARAADRGLAVPAEVAA